jgi:hypothetical protein
MAKLRFLGVQVKTPAPRMTLSGGHCPVERARKKAMGDTPSPGWKLSLDCLQKV